MSKVLWRGKEKEAGERQLEFIPDGELLKDDNGYYIIGSEMVVKEPRTIKKA
jgi:hypothetical protein